jgi:uncharacterized protein with PQ loop repeat
MNGDIFAFLAGSFCTISFIPQLYDIIKNKKLQISYSFLRIYLIGVFFWLLYGIFDYGNFLVIISSLQIILVASIIFFRNKNV